jgi:hypothetical protein
VNRVLRAGSAGVPDLEAVQQMRRDIGRDLAARRRAAGMIQKQFGARTGYTRSGVSTAESGSGSGNMSRNFWEACDRVLGTGTHFADWHDRIYAGVKPDPLPGPGPAAELRAASALKAPGLAEARAAYTRLGWPVSEAAGGLALATGLAADAFAVPRTAGALAARWWLETGGREDLVRGIPALPSPSTYLAVIDAGDRWYFLVRSGSSPWQAAAGSAPGPLPGTGDPAVLWHAAGSSVPAPPSSGGGAATWAFLPSRTIRLAPPHAVLYLLDRAAAAARDPAALILPGGTRVTPAAADLAPRSGDA